MTFAALHKIVDPQGMNYDDVGIFGARQVFVHLQPIEFVTILAGKGICSTIATRNLTRQNNSRQGGNFYGKEIDLVAAILAIIRKTRCRPCCAGK